MSNEQKQLIREKIEETLKNPPTWTDGDGRTQAERIMDIFDLAIKQTEKAFGGCKNCYGKGYSTTKQYATSHKDFGDEKTGTWELDPIHPCSCDRGKQIVELIANIGKQKEDRVVEKIEKEEPQNQITQAILGGMEYRGFDDCGKYLDEDIWERLKPFFITLIRNK